MSGSVCGNGGSCDDCDCGGKEPFGEKVCCDNFADMLQFSTFIVGELDQFPGEKSFSFVEFATEAKLVQKLTDTEDALDTIGGIHYSGGGTNHAEAIETCHKSMAKMNDRQNFIMLVTDGESTVPPNNAAGAAEDAADDAKADGSLIIPVFISTNNDKDALKFMERISSDGTVGYVTDFDALSTLQEGLIYQVLCS